jgi:hypothetical protein
MWQARGKQVRVSVGTAWKTYDRKIQKMFSEKQTVTTGTVPKWLRIKINDKHETSGPLIPS